MTITALDLFAGSGWGVACKRLGIEEMGVELMPEAIETRRLNGMTTIYKDVWEGLFLSVEAHALLYGIYECLIASPPCQTFSLAGKGAGRQALNEVLEAIRLHAYKDPAALLAFGEKHDMRTALVLTPLAYVYRDRPKYVVLEQVPTVLPVWEEYAKVMADWGYDVKTAILNAEQYGVPQTRRRAILVASLDGEAMLPVPSHSRYYSRNPKKLDPGVLPWVSMAEALGWGTTAKPCHTITGGTHGPTDRWASGSNHVRNSLDAQIGGPDWVERIDLPQVEGRTEYVNRFDVAEVAAIQTYPVLVNGNQDRATKRGAAAPSSTVCFGHNAAAIHGANEDGTTDQVTPDEAAALQTYPVSLRSNYTDPRQSSGKGERRTDHPAATLTSKADRSKWDGERRLDLGEAATLQTFPTGRGLTDRPSPTITGGGTETGGAEPVAKWHERYTGAEGWQGSTDRLSTDEAAALQTYPSAIAAATADPRPEWAYNRPSTTVVGTFSPDIISAPAGREKGGASRQSQPGSVRVSSQEAAVLQTYPGEPPFRFAGTKSKQFLQIGNAVPPLLAQRILEAQVMAGELI